MAAPANSVVVEVIVEDDGKENLTYRYYRYRYRYYRYQYFVLNLIPDTDSDSDTSFPSTICINFKIKTLKIKNIDYWGDQKAISV